MKKILINLLAILFLVTIVSAGIGLGAFDKSRTLEKAQRDELLSQTDAGEINPDISWGCNDEYCMYSAVQEGIINSHNNRFDKDYCDTTNETTGECLSYTDYTPEEIDDLVADKVTSRLSNYADASIERKSEGAFDDGRTGNLEITEK